MKRKKKFCFVLTCRVCPLFEVSRISALDCRLSLARMRGTRCALLLVAAAAVCSPAAGNSSSGIKNKSFSVCIHTRAYPKSFRIFLYTLREIHRDRERERERRRRRRRTLCLSQMRSTTKFARMHT